MELGAWQASAYAWDSESLQAYQTTSVPQHGEADLSSGQASGPTSGATDLSGDSGQHNGAKRSGGRAGGKARRRGTRAPAVCQVDGCGVSLDSGKPFYRLQKICEKHARAAVVTDASGATLRFCQQCTRLHPVAEFEGTKRSCVASLQRRLQRKQRQQAEDRDRQNEGLAAAEAIGRRRPRGGASSSRLPAVGGGDSGGAPLASNSPSHRSPATSGSGGSGSSNQVQRYANGAAPRSDQQPQQWGAPASGLGNGFPVTAATTSNGGQLTAVDPAHPMLQQSSGTQQLLASGQWAAGGSAGSTHYSPPGPLQAQQAQQAAQAAPKAPQLQGPCGAAWSDPQSLINSLSFREMLEEGMGDGLPPTMSVAVGGGATGARAQPPSPMSALTPDEMNELLVMDPDDLALALLARSEPATSAGMAGHVPITARGFGVVGSGPRPNSFGMHAASGMRGGAPQQPGAAGSLQPAGMPSTLPASRPMMPPGAPVALPPHGQALAAWPGAQAAGAVAQTAAAPLAQAAAAMLRMSPDQAMVVVRFSLKIYGLYPDQLPPRLQAELQDAIALAPTVLSGAIRSGCTQLTTTALLSGEEAARLEQPAGAPGALAALAASWRGRGGHEPWRLPAGMPLLRVVAQAEASSTALLLQPLEQAADGSGCAVAAGSSGRVYPVALGTGASERPVHLLQLELVGPAVTTASAARGMFQLQCPAWQQLLRGEGAEEGASVAAAAGVSSSRQLHCRCRGAHVAVALMHPGEENEDGSDDWAAGSEDASGSEPDGSDSGADEAAAAAAEERRRRALAAALAAQAWVPAAEKAWGLYEFELSSGALMGPPVPVLVLPDALGAAAAELQQLQAATDPAYTARVVRLAGMVLDFVDKQRRQGQEGAAAAAPLPPSALQRLAAAARWLCTLCVRCRWPALLRELLPACMAAGDAPAAAVAAMDAILPAGLLGTSAAANSAGLLRALGDWSAAAGHSWQGPGGGDGGGGDDGLTPLHLAAALGPALTPETAEALLAAVGLAAASARWRTALAGGWTPRQVAMAAGAAALLQRLEPFLSHPPAPAAPPATATVPAQPTTAAPEAEHPAAGGSGRELAEPSTSGGGGDGSAVSAEERERAMLKLASLQDSGEAAAAEEAEAAELAQLLNIRLDVEKTSKGEEGEAGGRHAGRRAATLPRLFPPPSAPELAAWRRRPLSPALLLALGAAAVLIVVGLSAALRSGLYD